MHTRPRSESGVASASLLPHASPSQSRFQCFTQSQSITVGCISYSILHIKIQERAICFPLSPFLKSRQLIAIDWILDNSGLWHHIQHIQHATAKYNKFTKGSSSDQPMATERTGLLANLAPEPIDESANASYEAADEEAGNGTDNGEGDDNPLYEGNTDIAKTMWLLFPAVSIGVLLSAADQTLIVTTYGKIGSDLKALNNTSWIATAYVIFFAFINLFLPYALSSLVSGIIER